ncbi:TspO/MBR family protein [Acidisphaera sp. L21]|jgi:benzodiazapine receptor|uniref:TspO/MBR family protein n=1 Tax=Acidisphaera sp. L21 TaxID=1641851 RepID=UPI00131B978B|nr:TspO/MBR family protein [Acidisphaera sp. L21]
MTRRWIPVATAAAAAIVVAVLGASATDISPWYVGLQKSPLTPPDWAFGPAWTLIYALTALSGVVAWHAANRVVRRRMLVLFAVNALLNVAWSEFFFMLRRPDWALIEVVPFWLSILLLIVLLRPASGKASWLLAPYLVWVAFAGWLNFEVVRLNGPFGQT